jgi:TIR domain
MAKIFMCHRRGDDDAMMRLLYDRLEQEFGREEMLVDVDAIPLGMDFRNVLQEAVSRSEVMLVLIGPRWLTKLDHDGRRRVDNPHDFVRMEIEQALQLSVPIIPVLLDGAPFPKLNEVPDTLRPLLFRHAVAISSASFQSDLEKLVRTLRSIRPKESVSVATSSQHGRLIERNVLAPKWRIRLLSAFASLLGVEPAMGVVSARGTTSFPEQDAVHLVRVAAARADGNEEVFISYARDDASIMQSVRRHLAKNEISVWTDDKLEPGTPSWKSAVQQAIEGSTCFVILLTPSAKDSELVQMELGYALAHERIVLPVLAKGTNRTAVPLEIINRQWIDITEAKFDDGLPKLVEAIIAYRAGKIPPRIMNQRR